MALAIKQQQIIPLQCLDRDEYKKDGKVRQSSVDGEVTREDSSSDGEEGESVGFRASGVVKDALDSYVK